MKPGPNGVFLDMRCTFKGQKSFTRDGQTRTSNLVSFVYEGGQKDFFVDDPKDFSACPNVGERVDMVCDVEERSTAKGKFTNFSNFVFYPALTVISLCSEENLSKMAGQIKARRAA